MRWERAGWGMWIESILPQPLALPRVRLLWERPAVHWGAKASSRAEWTQMGRVPGPLSKQTFTQAHRHAHKHGSYFALMVGGGDDSSDCDPETSPLAFERSIYWTSLRRKTKVRFAHLTRVISSMHHVRIWGFHQAFDIQMECLGFDIPQGNTAGLWFSLSFGMELFKRLMARFVAAASLVSRTSRDVIFVNYVRFAQCDLIIHSNRKPLRFYTKRLSQAHQLSLTVNSRFVPCWTPD